MRASIFLDAIAFRSNQPGTTEPQPNGDAENEPRRREARRPNLWSPSSLCFEEVGRMESRSYDASSSMRPIPLFAILAVAFAALAARASEDNDWPHLARNPARTAHAAQGVPPLYRARWIWC